MEGIQNLNPIILELTIPWLTENSSLSKWLPSQLRPYCAAAAVAAAAPSFHSLLLQKYVPMVMYLNWVTSACLA